MPLGGHAQPAGQLSRRRTHPAVGQQPHPHPSPHQGPHPNACPHQGPDANRGACSDAHAHCSANSGADAHRRSHSSPKLVQRRFEMGLQKFPIRRHMRPRHARTARHGKCPADLRRDSALVMRWMSESMAMHAFPACASLSRRLQLY